MAVNVGIIGCGLIAEFHVEAVKTTDATIAAVSDLDEERGGKMAAETGAAYVRDYHQLLADSEVPVVTIATPNHTHYRIACDALEAGKDILCEKPMTTLPEDAADLVEKVRQRPDQIFQVGYMKRYNNGFRLVKDLLPRVGHVFSAHIRVMATVKGVTSDHWYQQSDKSGGGILVHSGSHLLDVTRMLFGDPVKVDSRVRYASTVEGFDLVSLTLMDMEGGLSIYFSTLAVPIGKIGHTQQGWEETIEIIGSKGRIFLSSPNWEGTMPCIVNVQLDEENQVRTIYPDPVSQWETEIVAFLDSVETRVQRHPDVMDGYKVDEIIGHIYESGRRRAPVAIEWRC